MSLRLKLLLVFAVGALSALTFFGYIAYDTAKSTNIKNEVAVLTNVAPRVADDVYHDLEKNEKWDPVLLSDADANRDDPIYLFVTDRQGNIVSQPDGVEIRNIFNLLRPTISSANEIRGDSLSVGNSVYVWAAAIVPTYGYQTLLLSRSHVSRSNAFFKEMGVSLIVAAIFMLWVASWAAMYIAMLFEKLDEQKNTLRHRALHDELTGLPNRALLNDRLQQLVGAGEREPATFAMCFIDLNRFKEVNDSLGHHVGDELLLEVSKRLIANLRKSDTVARIGGDEFALIFRNVDLVSARAIAEKLLHAIELPIEIKEHKLFTSGSMGIAMFPEHGTSVESLLQKADVAMYAAKRAGTRLEFYSKEYDVFTRDKLALTHDLRDAIAHDQLDLYYQPKYHITEKKVVGAEALLRWKHPTIGFIPPTTFVQIAEHTGLIRALSKWVLQRAFSDCAIFDKQGYALNVSINLSAHNLQDPELEGDILALAEKWRVDPHRITLELTESAVVFNPAQTKELLTRLTTRGFRISVDDFGTGYSTLTNLRRLPISEIKIDRSFVDNITRDAEDASIVRATIELGKALNIDVIAEGVETQETLNALNEFGCHTIQGYFISKPLPVTAFLQWLSNESLRHTEPQPVVQQV